MESPNLGWITLDCPSRPLSSVPTTLLCNHRGCLYGLPCLATLPSGFWWDLVSFCQVMLRTQKSHTLTYYYIILQQMSVSVSCSQGLRVAHMWLCGSAGSVRALHLYWSHLSSHPRILAEGSVILGAYRRRVKSAFLFPRLPPYQVSAGCRLPVPNPHLTSPFLELCFLGPALLLLNPSCTGSNTILGLPSPFPNFCMIVLLTLFRFPVWDAIVFLLEPVW